MRRRDSFRAQRNPHFSSPRVVKESFSHGSLVENGSLDQSRLRLTSVWKISNETSFNRNQTGLSKNNHFVRRNCRSSIQIRSLGRYLVLESGHQPIRGSLFLLRSEYRNLSSNLVVGFSPITIVWRLELAGRSTLNPRAAYIFARRGL